MEKKPVANAHNVGHQAPVGPIKGQDVAYTNNPKGIVPQKIGGGMGSLTQDPVQPKVGK